jgi:hypothetical protein
MLRNETKDVVSVASLISSSKGYINTIQLAMVRIVIDRQSECQHKVFNFCNSFDFDMFLYRSCLISEKEKKKVKNCSHWNADNKIFLPTSTDMSSIRNSNTR